MIIQKKRRCILVFEIDSVMAYTAVVVLVNPPSSADLLAFLTATIPGEYLSSLATGYVDSY